MLCPTSAGTISILLANMVANVALPTEPYALTDCPSPTLPVRVAPADTHSTSLCALFVQQLSHPPPRCGVQ